MFIENPLAKENIYSKKGLRSLLSKSRTDDVDIIRILNANRTGESEVDLRWKLSNYSNSSFVCRIDEYITIYHKTERTLREKYAFREGIIGKMERLSTKHSAVKTLLNQNPNSLITCLDYGSLNSKNSLMLFEIPNQVISEYLEAILKKKVIHSDEFMSFNLIVEYYKIHSIPFTYDFDFKKLRHIYLPYSDFI